MKPGPVLCLILMVMLTNAAGTQAQVFRTQAEALGSAFANCDTVLRKVVFLDDDQAAKIQKLASAPLDGKIVTYYSGVEADTVVGYAFFETNVVRTKPETFMVLISSTGKVNSVEMLAFYEPLDYLPTRGWFGLFTDKKLGANLWPNRDIHGVTGATLTVRAVTQGVRLALATYHLVVNPLALNPEVSN